MALESGAIALLALTGIFTATAIGVTGYELYSCNSKKQKASDQQLQTGVNTIEENLDALHKNIEGKFANLSAVKTNEEATKKLVQLQSDREALLGQISTQKAAVDAAEAAYKAARAPFDNVDKAKDSAAYRAIKNILLKITVNAAGGGDGDMDAEINALVIDPAQASQEDLAGIYNDAGNGFRTDLRCGAIDIWAAPGQLGILVDKMVEPTAVAATPLGSTQTAHEFLNKLGLQLPGVDNRPLSAVEYGLALDSLDNRFTVLKDSRSTLGNVAKATLKKEQKKLAGLEAKLAEVNKAAAEVLSAN